MFVFSVATFCRRHAVTCIVAVLLLFGETPTQAQFDNRYGGGLQMMGSTVTQSAGPGLHLRTSFPMNRELSLAVGTALTGFVLRGEDESGYALDPEVSLVVTLPDPSSSSTYFLGGAGAHIPIGSNRYEDVVAGPTFHLGIGKVWQLGATSLYMELAPTLFFRRERTAVLMPLRGGIIF